MIPKEQILLQANRKLFPNKSDGEIAEQLANKFYRRFPAQAVAERKGIKIESVSLKDCKSGPSLSFSHRSVGEDVLVTAEIHDFNHDDYDYKAVQ